MEIIFSQITDVKDFEGGCQKFSEFLELKHNLYANYAKVISIPYHITIKNDEGLDIFTYRGLLDPIRLDALLIRFYFHCTFPALQEELKSSPIYRQFEKYLVEVLQDALRAMNDYYIEGDTVDYAFTIINSVVYLFTSCNSSSKNKAFWRISRNIGKAIPTLRLKDKEDPLVLSSRAHSKLILKEIPFTYNPRNCVYLHLNESVVRDHMRKHNIILKTSIIDVDEVRKT